MMLIRKWTRAEYQKMVEVGLLGPKEKVELIKGDIISMSPVDPIHSNSVGNATMVLVDAFGSTHSVRVQLPLAVGPDSEPEPDFCLIPLDLARQIARLRQHPDQAELVIEISNSSLAYDRGDKASLYASSRTPFYWVVNLIGSIVEVFSQPGPDPEATFGWSYSNIHKYRRGGRLEFSGRTLAVDDLLPPLDI